MEIWPVSSNIVVAPPEITTLSGRPAKNGKKEVEETKKSGKLPRTGLAMTCSVCHVRGHNKRGCPHRAPLVEPTAPAVATNTGSGRERGRSKKTPTEATNTAPQGKKDGSGRGRGRPKKTPPEAPNAAPTGKSNSPGRGRGRPKKTLLKVITEPPQGKKGRGRPKRIILVGATTTPLPTAPPVPTIFPASSSALPDFCTLSSIAETIKRGMDSGRGNTTPFKRQRVVGMGPGMPRSKIYSTGKQRWQDQLM
ncbi:uncharacterized protein LOC124896304 [Capsicum annuum]|uniref:uncharacterized protein LOC124896304 n=1 Tax=Capsicum annuum TaxID=4072 RepID=UPI001FB1029B|nr:uncharacterized protein LOC124896304 [Capsicum annuum]